MSPWIVKASPSAPPLKRVPGPSTRAPFWRVSVLPPVKVRSPLTVRSVKLPLELSRMLPLLIIVPSRIVFELLSPMKVPEFVNPLRVAVPRLRMTPVPTVVRMPPLIVAPLARFTSDPSSAWIRLLLLKAPPPLPFKRRIPPPLACIVP